MTDLFKCFVFLSWSRFWERKVSAPFFAFCIMQLFTPISSADVVERVLAIVNNKPITLTEFNDFKQRLQSEGLLDEALLKLRSPQKILSSRKATLNHLIDEKLLDHAVEAQNLSVPFERVEKEIRSIAQQNGITRKQLKQALAERGVKFSEYQDFIKTSLERKSLIEKEITSKIKISEDDISSYYISTHGAGDADAFEYTLSHIFFKKNDHNAEKKQKAHSVLKKLTTKPFEEMAEKFSEDPNYSQGGLLGTFKDGEMVPALEQAVAPLEKGEITGVVETQSGFHIIKVLNKKLIENPKIKKQKQQIRQRLLARAFKNQLERWLEEKRQDAFIRIN